jgi:hypothetical protein
MGLTSEQQSGLSLFVTEPLNNQHADKRTAASLREAAQRAVDEKVTAARSRKVDATEDTALTTNQRNWIKDEVRKTFWKDLGKDKQRNYIQKAADKNTDKATAAASSGKAKAPTPKATAVPGKRHASEGSS